MHSNIKGYHIFRRCRKHGVKAVTLLLCGPTTPFPICGVLWLPVSMILHRRVSRCLERGDKRCLPVHMIEIARVQRQGTGRSLDRYMVEAPSGPGARCKPRNHRLRSTSGQVGEPLTGWHFHPRCCRPCKFLGDAEQALGCPSGQPKIM